MLKAETPFPTPARRAIGVSGRAVSNMLFSGGGPSGSLCVLLSGPPRLPPKAVFRLAAMRTASATPPAPRTEAGGAVLLFSMAFGAGEIMPLVSSKHMIPGNPGSSTGLGANGIVAAGNEPVTKVVLIEDDSATAPEITPGPRGSGFEVEWSASGIEGLDK